MHQANGSERGIALAVAIFAIVVVGALVAAAFFLGTQEQRMGENVRRAQQAFGVAEAGVFELIRSWNPQAMSSRRWFPADSVHHADTLAPGGTGSYAGEVFKLNENLYLVDVTGRDRVGASAGGRDAGARQRVGMLVRVKPVEFDIRAAITAQGPMIIQGQAAVDGNVHVPPNWTNCGDLLDTARAGIRHPDTSQVRPTGGATARGEPPAVQDPSVADSTFTKFGDVTYADLAARATIKLPPGTYKSQPSLNSDGTCNTRDRLNWGDGVNRSPPGACASYYPIVHIAGSATVTGDQGQGILLVDGDLSLRGSYEFFGVTVVRGSLKSSGGGSTDAHFWGGVLAQNVSLDSIITLSGKATLNYSKCAILGATQNTGLVAPMRSRGWVQLF